MANSYHCDLSKIHTCYFIFSFQLNFWSFSLLKRERIYVSSLLEFIGHYFLKWNKIWIISSYQEKRTCQENVNFYLFNFWAQFSGTLYCRKYSSGKTNSFDARKKSVNKCNLHIGGDSHNKTWNGFVERSVTLMSRKIDSARRTQHLKRELTTFR